MKSLGTLYERQGDYAKALPLLSEGLEKSRLKLGREHPETLISMSRLGRLYRAAGPQAPLTAFLTFISRQR